MRVKEYIALKHGSHDQRSHGRRGSGGGTASQRSGTLDKYVDLTNPSQAKSASAHVSRIKSETSKWRSKLSKAKPEEANAVKTDAYNAINSLQIGGWGSDARRFNSAVQSLANAFENGREGNSGFVYTLNLTEGPLRELADMIPKKYR